MSARSVHRPTPSEHWANRLEGLALWIVLAVVCGRAVVQERSDTEQLGLVNRLQGALANVEGPGPTLSLTFDGIILSAAALTAVAGAVRGGYRRRLTLIEIAVGLMLVASIGSLGEASNKRLAINVACDRIACVLVLLVVGNTVRRWWQVRAGMAAIAATAVTFAVFCMTQVRELDETRRWLRDHRAEAVASGRISADDPMVELLERRAMAGEANGFFSHSNIAGGYLAACAMAVAGLGIARLRVRGRTFRVLFGVVTVLLAGVIFVGVLLTHGRGALAAIVLCVLGWLILGSVWYHWSRIRNLLIGRRYYVLAGAWILVVLMASSVVAYGRHRGGLPGSSLDFRWHYWMGAWDVFTRHWRFGVGAGNFDRHYVRYKPVEYAEEIKDPHNLIATAASEWGIVGVGATVLLVFGLSLALCRPGESRRTGSEASPVGSGSRPGITWLWLAAPLGAVLLARTLATPRELWVIWAMVPGCIWSVSAILLSLDSDQTTRFEDDALPLMGGLVAALMVVVIDNTISFSMVYAGSACTFFALGGLAIAVRRLEAPLATGAGVGGLNSHHSARPRWTWSSLTLAAVLAMSAIVYWPLLVTSVWAAEEDLNRAREALVPADVLTAYSESMRADSLDPMAAEELAGWALKQEGARLPGGRSGADLAVEAATIAVSRDPGDYRHHRTLAGAYAARHAVAGDANDVGRSVEAMARAVGLYPELPALRFDYGEVLALAATVQRDGKVLKEAADQMRLALQMDDRRPSGEIRRFTPTQRARLQERIKSLETLPLSSRKAGG